MKKALTILLIFFMTSCGAIEENPPIPKADSIFPDYTFLSLPVSDIRIGAQWIGNLLGTSGSGLDSEHIRVQRSYNNTVISADSASKLKLDAILLRGIGLSVEVLRANGAQIIYNNVEVVSVDDIQKMKFSANSKYIYKAIRVTDFTIKADQEVLLSVDASFLDQAGQYSANVTPLSSGRRISFGGEGLYVAYQLISFEKLQEKTLDVYLAKAEKFDDRYTIPDRYELLLDKEAVFECIRNFKNKRTRPYETSAEEGIGVVRTGNHVIVNHFYDECKGINWGVKIKNTNDFTIGSENNLEINLPFLVPFGAKTTSDPIVDIYIENENLVVDRLRIRYLRYQTYEFNFDSGTSSGGARVEGWVGIFRTTFALNVE